MKTLLIFLSFSIFLGFIFSTSLASIFGVDFIYQTTIIFGSLIGCCYLYPFFFLES